MSQRKQRLLVVDHEAIIAMSIQQKLIDQGYDVPAIAQSVEEVIQQVEALHPDLVLMDITLPGPSEGIKAAQLIRERFEVPVVCISDSADVAALEQVNITEPCGYILKPISDRELKIVVEMVLHRKRQDAILKRQTQQQATLAMFGAFALSDPSEDELFAHCVNAISTEPHVNVSMIFEAVSGGKELQLRDLSGVSARIGMTPILAIGELRDTLDTGRPGLIHGNSIEAQLLKSSFSEDREFGVGICVKIAGTLTPLGLLVACASGLTKFTTQDITFLKSLGMMLAGALQRKIMERELRNAARAAEDANREKSAFLANMSHEIRTPLGVVLGFSELLANNICDVSDTERLNFVSIIKRNGQLLSTVINDILDLSKIEAGKLDFEHIDIHFPDIIQEVAGPLQMMAKAKAITLDIKIDPNVPCFIKSDPTRLRQILLNVIGNSIKFTTRGSVMVLVKFHNSGDGGRHLDFVVKDSGCGIADFAADKLFAPFTQADESTSRRFGGTGLGLVCFDS